MEVLTLENCIFSCQLYIKQSTKPQLQLVCRLYELSIYIPIYLGQCHSIIKEVVFKIRGFPKLEISKYHFYPYSHM